MSNIYSYTEEEEKAIEELKRRTFNDLTPRLLEDETLFYRFLKARDFNIEKAENMLRKHLSDRAIYEIDWVATEYTPSEHAKAYIASSFIGYDKEGFTVRYIDLGGSDFKGVLTLFEFKEFFQFIINYLEKDTDRLREQTKKLGKPISYFNIIVNADKFNLYKATSKKALEWLIKGFTLYQDNFPERLKALYIINGSYYFNIGYGIFKPFLPEAIMKKFKIYGKTGWKEALLEVIDADVLPAFLGGTRTDPDGNPLCKTFIVHGIKVPEELYAKKCKQSIKNQVGVEKITVTRFSSFELELFIQDQNTNIEWEFETNNKDIVFALYYKSESEDNSSIVELLPKQKIDTMLSSETGIYKCLDVGTYIILFDNTYSWFRSKEIYYKIRLTKPGELN